MKGEFLSVPDEVWKVVRPLLPVRTRSRKGGRPPIHDRLVFNGNLAGSYLERSGQVDVAMSFVVVDVTDRASGAQRQWELRSFQRLDGRLFVHAQDDRVGRRVQIEPNDILDLAGERRISTHLARPSQVRLQPALS